MVYLSQWVRNGTILVLAVTEGKRRPSPQGRTAFRLTLKGSATRSVAADRDNSREGQAAIGATVAFSMRAASLGSSRTCKPRWPPLRKT